MEETLNINDIDSMLKITEVVIRERLTVRILKRSEDRALGFVLSLLKRSREELEGCFDG
jgi:hypothetical protein